MNRQNKCRTLVASLALGLTAFAGLGLTGSAQAAPAASTGTIPTGPLSIEPQMGTDQTYPVRLITAQVCPSGATNYKVKISGAGFPDLANAIGNQVVRNLDPSADEGLVVPLWGTWRMVADTNEVKGDLDGLASLDMLCIDKFGKTVYAANIGKIQFTKHPGAPSTYAQVGGPKLSSGIPLTSQDRAALERNDGSFPPPPSGDVTIEQVPPPADSALVQGRPAKAGKPGDAGVTSLSGGAANAVPSGDGKSDVKADGSAPTGSAASLGNDAQLAATGKSGSGGGGISPVALVAIVLLLALAAGGALFYRASRES
jgi:hypothetical protein